jgi:hypothetical protein
MSDPRVPLDACPCCARPIECASALDGSARRPAPGDVTICVSCGAVLRYGPDLRTVHAPEVEPELDPGVRAMIAKIRRRGPLARPEGPVA